MGAWGEGLQANDTALDAIREDELRKIRRTKNATRVVEVLQEIKDYFGTDDWTWGVLGIAEYLLDDGFPPELLKPSRAIIDEALAIELDQENLDCWKTPASRAAVLALFQRRLNGEQVSEEEIAASNEGLLSKLIRRSPPATN